MKSTGCGSHESRRMWLNVHLSAITKAFFSFLLMMTGQHSPLLEDQAQAAPYLGTSTSSLISSKPGLFISEKGFTISAERTTWVLTEPHPSIPFIEAVFKPSSTEESMDATFSIRVDPVEPRSPEHNINLCLGERDCPDPYIRRWLSDYPKYGFDVLAARPIKLKNLSGYLVDAQHSRENRQLRQVIFLRGNRAAVLTCRDHPTTFLKTLRSCNQIYRNFRWLTSL